MGKAWETDKFRDDFNEYYTTYTECELVLGPIINKLMDKHIHCPADDENSNIVKWLKNNTNSKITYSGLPDVDMNSNRAHRLMLEADMVITNPPFSMRHWRPLFIWLNDIYADEYHKDYFIWGPAPFSGAWVSDKLLNKIKYIYVIIKNHKALHMYVRPDGNIKHVNVVYYCSWKVPHLRTKYRESNKKIRMYKGTPVFDKCENVPPTYGGWMYVPCSYLECIYLEDYEIDSEAEQVPGKFVRWKIRKKRGNYGKDI